MIQILGVHGLTNVSRVTINGAHISATIDGKPTDIRGNVPGLGNDWYDEDHAACMDAIHTALRYLDKLLVAKGAKR